MTPAARVAAAIACLDQILSGDAAERVLTQWARSNRYAGSGDRAAVRDHVFDTLRRRRSAAALGGGETGRGLMIGLLRGQGADVPTLFDGSRYGPACLTSGEGESRAMTRGDELDLQDWCLPYLDRALGQDAENIALALRDRAPVFLRVNTAKAGRDRVIADLAAESIETEVHNLAETALVVTQGARRIRQSQSYLNGKVELQDAASQAIVEFVKDAAEGTDILDYCAGGGGKALALAALGPRSLTAHDANVGRMKDIPSRARRAGAKIDVQSKIAPNTTFDLVFVDAPCSGSGAWRRQPEAKWRLTEEALLKTIALQDQILKTAAQHVRPKGVLAYATCSLFQEENQDRVAAFLTQNEDWRLEGSRALTPLDGGDGFYVARLRAPKTGGMSP